MGRERRNSHFDRKERNNALHRHRNRHCLMRFSIGPSRTDTKDLHLIRKRDSTVDSSTNKGKDLQRSERLGCFKGFIRLKLGFDGLHSRRNQARLGIAVFDFHFLVWLQTHLESWRMDENSQALTLSGGYWKGLLLHGCTVDLLADMVS